MSQPPRASKGRRAPRPQLEPLDKLLIGFVAALFGLLPAFLLGLFGGGVGEATAVYVAASIAFYLVICEGLSRRPRSRRRHS